MTAPIDDEDEMNARRKKSDDGEGDSDSFGRGKAGAGASGGIRLSPQKLKEVMANWRHLDVAAAMESLVEFVGEGVLKVSKNLEVAYEKTKAAANNIKSFAIVGWVVEFQKEVMRNLANKQEQKSDTARDTRGLQRQKPRTAPGFGISPGPAGPNGQ